MKVLRLSQFYEGEYEDIGYELYFLKDIEGRAMYIGISRGSIWHRWFGGGPSHMAFDSTGKVYGKSYIGEVIQRRFPNSWDWIIELWTKGDCLKACKSDILEKNVDRIEIESLEPYMIQKFQPLYNVAHGGGRHEDPLTTNNLDKIYKDLFG